MILKEVNLGFPRGEALGTPQGPLLVPLDSHSSASPSCLASLSSTSQAQNNPLGENNP